MQFPVIIGLHRSRLLDAGFGIFLAGAAIFLSLWPPATPFRLLVLPASGVLWFIVWRQLTPRLSAIRLEQDGKISVMLCGEAAFVAAEPLPGAVVHPLLCVVRLKLLDGSVQRLNATVGAINWQNFRRLRVFLRWRAKFSEPVDVA